LILQLTRDALESRANRNVGVLVSVFVLSTAVRRDFGPWYVQVDVDIVEVPLMMTMMRGLDHDVTRNDLAVKSIQLFSSLSHRLLDGIRMG
jgi:hypothetical protein